MKPNSTTFSSPQEADDADISGADGALFLENKHVGRVKLVRTLGKGVSGKVKLGVVQDTMTKVAVKVFGDKNDPSFESEIQALLRLQNEHVVKVLGWGSATIQTKGK